MPLVSLKQRVQRRSSKVIRATASNRTSRILQEVNENSDLIFCLQRLDLDNNVRCPLRQTLPIFKQPVTHYPSERDEVKAQVNKATGGKPSEKTKPRQLFWEKRFDNIRATDVDEQPLAQFQLPDQIKGNQLS